MFRINVADKQTRPYSSLEPLEPRVLLAADPLAVVAGPWVPSVVQAVNPGFAQDVAPSTRADASQWDLVAALGKITVPRNGLQPGGKKGSVKVLVKNDGPVKLPHPQAIDVEVFAHLAGAADNAHDVLLGTVSGKKVANLGINKVKKVAVKLTAPSSLAGGRYELIALVDTGDDLPEIDENNNASAPSAALSIGISQGNAGGALGVFGSIFEFQAEQATNGVESGTFSDDNGNAGTYSYAPSSTLQDTARLTGTLTSGGAGTVDFALVFSGVAPASIDGRLITLSAAGGDSGTVQGFVDSEGTTATFSGTFQLADAPTGIIVSTTGAVAEVATPSNTANGVLESNTQIFAFAERQGLTLANDLGLEISVPGTSPSSIDANPSPLSVPAGTVVNSFMLHFDVLGAPNVQHVTDLQGSVTFDSPILGLIYSHDALNDTNNVLGAEGTNYAFNSQRGLELNPAGRGTSDVLTLSADMKTLTVDLRNGPNVDDLRIVLAVPTGGAIGSA